MQQTLSLLIGILVLFLGIPLGSYLAKTTKDELESGQKWFKLIIAVSLVGGFAGLILSDDVLMFSLFFIAIVTSRSLR
ncbi:MAG: hypothetical protein ABIJ14_00445 [Nanoarchaeota archaeon]|nr:hypothetical protein [Nanoarchaeota archaeon]